MCSTALSILQRYVDALYLTSKAPTDFSSLENVFMDSMQLEVHPEMRGDYLYLFGQSKPCIRVPQLQHSLGFSTEQEAAVPSQPPPPDATACHEIRLCILLAALAICQVTQTSQFARGFALMVKAILGEVRVARLHVTSDRIQEIAKLLGENERVLDMLDASFDAIAKHSLHRLEASK